MPELRLFAELKTVFGSIHSRRRLHGHEIDLYVGRHRFGIEIDGSYWHMNKATADARKGKVLTRHGITLIRIRQEGLDKLSPVDLVLTNKEFAIDRHEVVCNILIHIADVVKFGARTKRKINKYLSLSRFANESEFRDLLNLLPGPLPGNSLWDSNKPLLREWHVSKSGKLTAKDVHP